MRWCHTGQHENSRSRRVRPPSPEGEGRLPAASAAAQAGGEASVSSNLIFGVVGRDFSSDSARVTVHKNVDFGRGAFWEWTGTSDPALGECWVPLIRSHSWFGHILC